MMGGPINNPIVTGYMDPSLKQREEDRALRLRLYYKIRRWDASQTTARFEKLWRLLGLPADHELAWDEVFGERERRICKQLDGPHGYAIFKALAQRANADDALHDQGEKGE